MYNSDDEQYSRFGEVRQLCQHGRGYQRQHHEVREVRRVHAVGRWIALTVCAVRKDLTVGPARYLQIIGKTVNHYKMNKPYKGYKYRLCL